MHFFVKLVQASLIFALLGPAIATHAEAAEIVKKAFPGVTIKKLDLQNAAGEVVIKGGAAEAGVTATKRKFDKGCTLKIELEGDTLVVDNTNDDNDNDCEVDLSIALPRNVNLDLKIGAGDVNASGVAGELEFKLGSGDLVVSNAALTAVDGKSGSGDITLSGSIAQGELKIGAGNATVNYTEAPGKGSLDIKLGTGNAIVNLPKDSKVKTSFRSALGSLTNEVGDTVNAPYTISGSAGVGDLTIKKM